MILRARSKKNSNGLKKHAVRVAKNSGALKKHAVRVAKNSGALKKRAVRVARNSGALKKHPVRVSRNSGALEKRAARVAEDSGRSAHRIRPVSLRFLYGRSPNPDGGLMTSRLRFPGVTDPHLIGGHVRFVSSPRGRRPGPTARRGGRGPRPLASSASCMRSLDGGDPSERDGRQLIASRIVSTRESNLMMDVFYIGLTLGLFGLTWGLVRLCDSV